MTDFWAHLIRSGVALAVRAGVHRDRLHAMVNQGYRDLNVIPYGAGLTPRQNDILRLWYRNYAESGEWPTIRQAQRDLDISSPAVVVYNLNVLVNRDMLVHRPGRTPAYITPSGRWAGTL